ncbi:hypothetical protein NBH00_22775 [Paraconexibacter antarcticus]|uniref:Uncharacterized protein n=1 Tax=Paraconexibacter antarcticus TaxID=2949664 RepID=A0ABY5DRT5_9ACTN|nr:hypothetical protein [Paraconexibacter antarcticus]UTI64150.1 hypothetical protein NBH00_22775 [Paraconexibacter antarcticus]
MSRPGSRLRLLALLGLAAWSVHELRYALAYGHDASGALRGSGHAYLGVAGPLVGLLVLVAAGQLVHALARRGGGGHTAGPGGAPPMSLTRTWAVLTGALLAAYSAQELLEGALAAGHASGAAALVAHGGWLAAPLAAAAALAVALVLREAEEAVAAAPVAAPAAGLLVAAAPLVRLRPAAARAARAPLARHLAGRGPPVPVTP